MPNTKITELPTTQDVSDGYFVFDDGETTYKADSNTVKDFVLDEIENLDLSYVDEGNGWIQLMNNDGTDNLFPIIKMDLLWTNESPTSAFAPQTVELDLSSYKSILIVWQAYTGTGKFATLVPMLAYDYVASGFIDSSVAINKRKFTPSTTGIAFAGGTNSTSSNNSSCIPNLIYGIK